MYQYSFAITFWILFCREVRANPWHKLYAFQPATVLPNISPFLCLKLCYVSYFLNHLTQIALLFFFFRSSLPEVVCKEGVPRNFVKLTGKHLCQSLVFWYCCRPQIWNFIEKETLAHVFSCEFCENSKNILSYRTPPVAASVFLNVSFITSYTPHFTLFTFTSTLFYCF